MQKTLGTTCKAYVKHRFIRVCELIHVENLLLVPYKMIPANIVTQGLAPLQLEGNMFWKHGSKFNFT